MGSVKSFIERHFRHFNAAVIVDAAEAWARHLEEGGQMLLTMAGAMSTAEMGVVVAELVRQGKVHAISLTGANLEEDVFNLVAHESYVRLPSYRSLTDQQEQQLRDGGLNRVTDTCIPEEEAMRKIESDMLDLWKQTEDAGERRFPHEWCYELLRGGKLEGSYQIPPEDSWLLAAAKKDLPLFVPGWEDSTLGNMFVAAVERGDLQGFHSVKGGLEYMHELMRWYVQAQERSSVGFFQIGGGIAGDFPICVVPMLHQDLGREVRRWGYFCQIGDSTTSYGSYSGAVPNEKISWGKLEPDTPRFVIESDATIVFPLVAAYVLEL